MSDQDFFFEEEDEATPAPKRAARPTNSTKPAAKSAKPAAKPTAKAASAPSPSIFSQDVSMTVAALMAAIALLIGVIIGIVIPTGNTAVQSAAPASTATDAGSTAPQLTEEQLTTGEMPAGHPDISGMSAGTTETPASGETTPAP